MTRRRNRDAGQEAQARIYISIAPCAENFLAGVEIDVAFPAPAKSRNGCERSSSSALRRSILRVRVLSPVSVTSAPGIIPLATSPPRPPFSLLVSSNAYTRPRIRK